jgi:hypothetical protein
VRVFDRLENVGTLAIDNRANAICARVARLEKLIARLRREWIINEQPIIAASSVGLQAKQDCRDQRTEKKQHK